MNLCATCASDPAWTHRARRLAALALDILETAPRDHRDGPADPHAGALAECALRLVVAMRTPASWRCRGRGPRTRPRRDDAEAISDERDDAEAISDGRDDAEAISDGRRGGDGGARGPFHSPREAHHARLCAVAAELASRSDVAAAAPLVDVAARAMQPELARAEEVPRVPRVPKVPTRNPPRFSRERPGFARRARRALASPLTHAGLPRDALASFTLARRGVGGAAALRDVPGDTPEIFAIDTLLGTVTGWRAVQSAPVSTRVGVPAGVGGSRAISDARESRAIRRRGDETRSRRARDPDPPRRDARRGLVSREGCRGVPRGGVVRPRRRRRTEAKRSVLGDVVLGDVVLGDARRRRRALRRHATVLGASGRGRGRGRGRENARWWWNDDVIRDRVSRAASSTRRRGGV